MLSWDMISFLKFLARSSHGYLEAFPSFVSFKIYMHGKLWMSSLQQSQPCLIWSYNLRYRTWKEGDAKLKYSRCFFLKNSYIYISSNSKQISLSPFDENQLRSCQDFRYFGDISYILTLILACKLSFQRKKYAPMRWSKIQHNATAE